MITDVMSYLSDEQGYQSLTRSNSIWRTRCTQGNEYNWNATSGGKFEAFCSQSFHARLNTAKTKHV